MRVYDYSGLKGKSCWKKTLISPALHAELHATSIGPRSNYVYRHVEGCLGMTTNRFMASASRFCLIETCPLDLWFLLPPELDLGSAGWYFVVERSDFEVYSDRRRRKTSKKRGRRGLNLSLTTFKTPHMDIHESWTAACSCCHGCHVVRPSLRKRGTLQLRLAPIWWNPIALSGPSSALPLHLDRKVLERYHLVVQWWVTMRCVWCVREAEHEKEKTEFHKVKRPGECKSQDWTSRTGFFCAVFCSFL